MITIDMSAGRMWRAAACWTSSALTCGDARAISIELVVGQIEDDQAAQRRGDLGGTLESEREDADEVVARNDQLIRLDLGLDEGAHDAQGLEHGGHGHRRFDRGPDHERPRPAAHVERGADAVGVAQLLANNAVEARIEGAAEDRVEHRQGVEVGRAARNADVPDAHLGLRRSRTIDEHQRGLGRRDLL